MHEWILNIQWCVLNLWALRKGLEPQGLVAPACASVSFAKKYGQYGQTSYKGRIGQFSPVVNCCLIALPLLGLSFRTLVHMLPPPLLCKRFGRLGRCLIRLFIVRQTHSIIPLSEESILDCVSTFAPCLREDTIPHDSVCSYGTAVTRQSSLRRSRGAVWNLSTKRKQNCCGEMACHDTP